MKPISPSQVVKTKVKPISPSQVKKEIPEGVIEAFNELIQKYYQDGRAQFKLDEAVKLVCKKMKCKRDVPCDEHWMDVESLYEHAGWKVEFDNPGYNETYPATYTFRRK
jgi:hypothetical protein